MMTSPSDSFGTGGGPDRDTPGFAEPRSRPDDLAPDTDEVIGDPYAAGTGATGRAPALAGTTSAPGANSPGSRRTW